MKRKKMPLFEFCNRGHAEDCFPGVFRTIPYLQKSLPRPGRSKNCDGTLTSRPKRPYRGATSGSGPVRPMVTKRTGVTNLKGRGLVAVKTAVKRGKPPSHNTAGRRSEGRNPKAVGRRRPPNPWSHVIGRSTRPKIPGGPWISTTLTESIARRERSLIYRDKLFLFSTPDGAIRNIMIF
ncbi:hypothetical protein NPIL_363981 [Nephila pilipes]|uniref:Uncharacterized protein n=1 Tax=Nephila pilipes TaxID=299642 RepID=A0A8X6JT49_NEPPI|nr:hypothetical protein NPIL_363981 [Nephila pilipes]